MAHKTICLVQNLEGMDQKFVYSNPIGDVTCIYIFETFKAQSI